MTTILGLKAAKGKSGIIMASDLQGTAGDEKTLTRKLYVNEIGDSVAGVAGIYDAMFRDFLGEFVSGKYDIERIVKKGEFPQLRKMNIARWEGREPSNEKGFNSMLLGTNIGGNPELFTCWPLGLVEPRTNCYIGRGAKFVQDYWLGKSIVADAEQGAPVLDPDHLSLDEGIDLAEKALGFASKDLYSVGFDIVVIADEIFEAPELHEESNLARNRAIKKIKKKINN